MSMRRLCAILVAAVAWPLGADASAASFNAASLIQGVPSGIDPAMLNQLRQQASNSNRSSYTSGNNRSSNNRSSNNRSSSNRSSNNRSSNNRSSNRSSNNRSSNRGGSSGSSGSSFSRNDNGERMSFGERRKKRREESDKKSEERRKLQEERRERFKKTTTENREMRERGKEAVREMRGGGAGAGSAGSSSGGGTAAGAATTPVRPIGPEDLAQKLLIIGDIHLLNERPGNAVKYYRELLDRFPESKYCDRARETLVELAAK